MAKRKKAGAKPAAARRTTRRGKQQADAAAEGEPSTPTEQTNSDNANQEPPPDTPASSADALDPKTEVAKPQVPAVALHKKFGKYRCLFNSDESFTKKYEMGSDSENSSNIEIKGIDPCAGSESDSNAPLDTHSDTNSGACYSPVNAVATSHNVSREISPITIQESPNPVIDSGGSSPVIGIPFLCDDEPVNVTILKSPEKSELPVEPVLEPESKEIPVPVEMENIPLPELEETPHLDKQPTVQEANQDIPLEDHMMYTEGDDDEIITVVQIVEDDHPELYYDIKIDSPKDMDSDTLGQSDQKPVALGSSESEIQKHFENLNLMAKPQAQYQMDCSDVIDITTPPCVTPDLYSKDEGVMRPDPSLTPSSTLSDDSNSSRAVELGHLNSNDSAESSPTGVRRSSRLKTISNMKQKTKGYGLVKTPLKKALITQTKLKLEEMGSDSQEKSSDLSLHAPNSPSFPVPSEMPVKVKSRWRRSSELEMGAGSPASSPLASPSLPKMPPVAETKEEIIPLSKEAYDKIIEERMNQFQHLEENEYLCERMISRDTKKMICDCFMTKEELERGELACGEDCLNRLLMIECNSRCPVGDRCTNRRFQKKQDAPLKVFYADKKGCGVEAAADIPTGEFLMEYVGEVLDCEQFYKRAQAYSDENNLHHYFMSLKGDTVIDATLKGNISRFINHSCEPNAETQKWTVNGELRIGFFSKRDIQAGEELTFDYQFQRFGKVAQRCYCGAENCRGWIGAEPDSDDEDYEEEEDVSTSKSESLQSPQQSADSGATDAPPPRPRRERKYKPKPRDLVQDADIEEEVEALKRSGIKNQVHTLRLSRTIVRARTRRSITALLRLLRDAHLPCRRLFLDYRGLRLLAIWAATATLDTQWEILQTLDRLPIPNKTMVQESRFFNIVEKWRAAADVMPLQLVDEATGLPVELPNRDGASSPDVSKDNTALTANVKELANQLLERWASLKEVFKIPKKERIQQMKEHERQANVERRAADSSGSRDREKERDKDRDREKDRDRDRDRDRERDRERERERDRDRYRERERDREREREMDREDRERRKRRSPDGRRSIRLSDRVLAPVPPMSKEERRRAFAEAAAAADETRRRRESQPHWPYWHPDMQQMFPPGMMGGQNMQMMMQGGNMMQNNMMQNNMMPNNMMPNNMMPNNMMPNNLMPNNMMANNMMPNNVMPNNMMPGMMGGMQGEVSQEWMELQGNQAFCAQFQQQQQFCMPQPGFGQMGMSGFNMAGFMFGQQAPPQQFPQHDVSQPPPSAAPPPSEVVLPSLWRSARDAAGRTYYYHVKLRQPQWLPPPPPEESSSEEEEEQANPSDSPLVRRQMMGKVVEGVNGIYEVIKDASHNGLIPEHALVSVKPRKRRPGLVSERPISPRTEEDKLAGRMEVKRYKQTKEKLRRRKEKLLQKVRLLSAKTKIKTVIDAESKLVDLIDSDSDSEDSEVDISPPEPAEVPEVEPSTSIPQPVEEPSPKAASPREDPLETARRIKEQFRSSMARVMVQHLNPYRHTEAPVARITCTADFKHLARKLTHFVMLKELKHCRSVEELVVTDSVRSKAKMFVRKYMAKFGPVYKRPDEEAD